MNRPLVIALALTASQAPAIDFVKDIQPIFKEHCYKCHGDPDGAGPLTAPANGNAAVAWWTSS